MSDCIYFIFFCYMLCCVPCQLIMHLKIMLERLCKQYITNQNYTVYIVFTKKDFFFHFEFDI